MKLNDLYDCDVANYCCVNEFLNFLSFDTFHKILNCEWNINLHEINVSKLIVIPCIYVFHEIFSEVDKLITIAQHSTAYIKFGLFCNLNLSPFYNMLICFNIEIYYIVMCDVTLKVYLLLAYERYPSDILIPLKDRRKCKIKLFN